MKASVVFVCERCDAQFPKWQGRCTECGAWSTLKEQTRVSRPRVGRTSEVVTLSEVGSGAEQRLSTGLREVDRVLSGGFVPGSLTLLGGDPGIGKSTLILQIAALLAAHHDVLYISGEESAEQVALRFRRLKVSAPSLKFFAETDVDAVVATIDRTRPALAVIDSIQTLAAGAVPSEAGSVPQVRASTVKLLNLAKSAGVALVLIGHVTKEGAMAGPKALEHLVDTVLYLEGDRYHAFRVLRAVKHRFGSTNEVGVFDMRDNGLREVDNPSAVFLAERQGGPGSVVTCTVEGSRAFLVEIQALVNPTHFGLPRRTSAGIDPNRLQLLLAVLTKRCGLRLGAQDVFVNVVGGVRVTEPAADLAIALAIASATTGQPVHPKLVAIGEVGLGGELRSVSHLERRLKECAQLGFSSVVMASQGEDTVVAGIDALRVRTVRDAIAETLGRVAVS